MTSDLDLLRQKRAAELRRKMLLESNKAKQEAEPPKPKPAPRDIVRKSLVGRGVEVLETARRYYPAEVAQLEVQIASLVESGRLKGPISGEELYTFLLRAGLRFNMNTKIRIAEGGELKSIEEKLRGHTGD